MRPKTIRYRAFLYDPPSGLLWKGSWRNTISEAAEDAEGVIGAIVQKIQMGSPVRITEYPTGLFRYRKDALTPSDLAAIMRRQAGNGSVAASETMREDI